MPFLFSPVTTIKLRILPFLFLALTVAACGSDSSDSTGSSESANVNSNFANANPATHRVEFPKLKDASTNIIIVHNSGGEVNYSVEYDTSKKLSRWSCYEIYASNRFFRRQALRTAPHGDDLQA